MSNSETISVLIPTWRRAGPLAVCLRSIARQQLPPTRVVVVRKIDDRETSELLAGPRDGWIDLPVVDVVVPPEGNFLTQLNAGIAATRESIVAITDDDAEPKPDWLSRIRDAFDDAGIVGVGGRDWQPYERGDREIVGIVSWFGRVVGNHHLGAGLPRRVDLLKGVNWAFRGEVIRALGVDGRLRGSGTVMNTEMAVCLPMRRRGMTLIYDPAIAVDHHVAPRVDGDVTSRGGFDARRHRDAVHNETLALLDYLPAGRRTAFIVWAVLIGTHGGPGVAQLARLLLRRSPNAFGRWIATMRGRLDGFSTHRRGRRLA